MSPSSPAHALSSRPWKSGPLDAAQRGFDLLTQQPVPLAFDCRGIDALPQRVLALDELKRLLIRRTTPRATQDAVWAELVTRARRDGPAWVVAAVGIAIPGLRHRAALLARGWLGDIADLDSDLLLGFLERLGTIDVEAGNICSRLIEAGVRTVQRSRRHSESTDAVRTGRPGSVPPPRPWDHPDFVLARAVAAAVIGPEECFLIGETRLGDMTLKACAHRLGVPSGMAGSWRAHAEAALRTAIAQGELRWVRLPGAW